MKYWSTRELQFLLGYSKWENFTKVIDKAKKSRLQADRKLMDHFPEIRKTTPMSKSTEIEEVGVAV
ncbi:MAG: hypothetical protein J1E79_05285 [Rikenella sp.]|nr:hypothetical protein [Rikenella sp.]